VCCCEVDCECQAVVVKDGITEVGWCLYVAVFRMGSFAQALNAYRCFFPWRSFYALNIYRIRVMSRMYIYHTCLTGTVCNVEDVYISHLSYRDCLSLHNK
jgi:hypothetical protein